MKTLILLLLSVILVGCTSRIEENELTVLGKRGLGYTYYIGSDEVDHIFTASYFLKFDYDIYVEKTVLQLDHEASISKDRTSWYRPDFETIYHNDQFAGLLLVGWIRDDGEKIKLLNGPIKCEYR